MLILCGCVSNGLVGSVNADLTERPLSSNNTGIYRLGMIIPFGRIGLVAFLA